MRVSAPVSVSATVSPRAGLFGKRWLPYAGSSPKSCPLRAAAASRQRGGLWRGRWRWLALWTAPHASPGECAPFLRARIRRLASRAPCPGAYHRRARSRVLFSGLDPSALMVHDGAGRLPDRCAGRRSGRCAGRGPGRRTCCRARLWRSARSHQLRFRFKPVFLISSGNLSILFEDRIGHSCDFFVRRFVVI